METAGSSGTSVIIYQSVQRHISQDLNLRQHCCENFTSRAITAYLLSYLGPLPMGQIEGSSKLTLVYGEKRWNIYF